MPKLGRRLLSSITNAFEKLFKFLRSQRKGPEFRLDTFCEACSLVSILFSCLGLAFKLAELGYVAKERDLLEASKRFENMENIHDEDVANDTAKTPGSHSRNLRRVRQSLHLIRALFEEFLANESYSREENEMIYQHFTCRWRIH